MLDRPLFTVWYKLQNINGSLASLSGAQGFRNYVALRLGHIGVSGYIQRKPRTDADLIVKGTREQQFQVRNFLREIRGQGMISAPLVVNSPPEYEVEEEFIVLASDRPRVITGQYSDPALDNVSTSSHHSETPILQSPNIH